MVRGSSTRKRSSVEVFEEEEEVEEMHPSNAGSTRMQFSQIEAEDSQAVPRTKDFEEVHFTQQLTEAVQEKAIRSLSRLILFKALAGECIERRKCLEEVNADDWAHGNKRSLTTVAFARAVERVEETFGFKVAGIPPDIAGALPSRFKDRYYVINALEDPDGNQSKQLHSYFGYRDRGLLMTVLSLAFCKGAMRQNVGERIEGIRWISDQALYRLLNYIDERISDQPPEPSSSKSNAANQRRTAFTREIDAMMDRLVQMDYLLKEKGNPENVSSTPTNDQGYSYAMGPRYVHCLLQRRISILEL
jgi:hypothetical protein